MADFSAFPAIEKVARRAKALDRSFVASTILANYHEYGHDGGLRSVDLALQSLHAHGTLDEQVRDLFGSEFGKWWKAYTELLGLSTFAQRSMLAATQWPPGFPSDTPPFDGVLRTSSGHEFVFDIKNGGGSGSLLLEERLSPLVEKWRRANALPAAQIEVAHAGPLVQPLIGDEVQTLLREVRSQLEGVISLPQTLRVYLTTLEGDLRLDITLTESSAIRVSSGIASVDRHATYLRGVIESHARHKNEAAESHNAPPFFLVYVVPFGAAMTDFRDWQTQCAMRMFEEPSLRADAGFSRWMGILYLDFLGNDVRVSGYVRESAPLPAGLTREQLREQLQLHELWPCRLG